MNASAGAVVISYMIENKKSLKEACDDIVDKMKKSVKTGAEDDNDGSMFGGCTSDFGADIKL